MKRTSVLKLGFLSAAIIGVFILGCSKSGTGDDGDDGNTPFMVIDLSVTVVTDSSVTLVWTATGDDADVGIASVYDMRCWGEWITINNWDSVYQLTGEPTPSSAGQKDSMVVCGLEHDSTYYFSLRVSDEANNWTNPSNCVFATCFEDIVVAFPDPALDALIRTLISVPTGDIHRSDLMGLTFLDGNDQQIVSLSGVEYCCNLGRIYMSWNGVSDLTPLANLTKLDEVQFAANDITDISPLANLNDLTFLVLAGNAVTNISVVSDMSLLRRLQLDNNQVSDLSPIVANSSFAAEDTLWIHNNPLSQESIDVLIPQLEARGVTVIQ